MAGHGRIQCKEREWAHPNSLMGFPVWSFTFLGTVSPLKVTSSFRPLEAGSIDHLIGNHQHLNVWRRWDHRPILSICLGLLRIYPSSMDPSSTGGIQEGTKKLSLFCLTYTKNSKNHSFTLQNSCSKSSALLDACQHPPC